MGERENEDVCQHVLSLVSSKILALPVAAVVSVSP